MSALSKGLRGVTDVSRESPAVDCEHDEMSDALIGQFILYARRRAPARLSGLTK